MTDTRFAANVVTHGSTFSTVDGSMTFDPYNWRSVSFEPMPESTSSDYAAYFPGGIIDVERTAADNEVWIHDSLKCFPPSCNTS